MPSSKSSSERKADTCEALRPASLRAAFSALSFPTSEFFNITAGTVTTVPKTTAVMHRVEITAFWEY